MHLRLFQKHLSKEMAERYLGEKNGCFSRVTGEEARTSLEQAARDLLFLVLTFDKHAVVSKRPKFGLLADTSYGSDDNVLASQEEGVELVAPAPGEVSKAQEMLVLRDFILDPETQNIVHGPAGHAPEETTVSWKDGEKEGKHTARFAEAHCQGCVHREYCQIGLNSKHRMQYTDKQARLEERRFREASPEFKDRYRMHSGIKATNAQLKKWMPGGRLRVRGLKAVRFAVTLKALGVNIQRAVHWPKKRKKAGKRPFFGSALPDLGENLLRRMRFFPALPPRR